MTRSYPSSQIAHAILKEEDTDKKETNFRKYSHIWCPASTRASNLSRKGHLSSTSRSPLYMQAMIDSKYAQITLPMRIEVHTEATNGRPLCGSVDGNIRCVDLSTATSLVGDRSAGSDKCRPRSSEGSSCSKKSDEDYMEPWVYIKSFDESLWKIVDINLVILQLVRSRAHEACVWIFESMVTGRGKHRWGAQRQ
jgi:hypothetical protein